jgi:hypothetical protein
MIIILRFIIIIIYKIKFGKKLFLFFIGIFNTLKRSSKRYKVKRNRKEISW